jgi:uncharacterized protein YdaU (DUF1376 family)
VSFDWYPWYVQAWRKNTMHLGLAEDGAYRRLIDEYMMTRGPLPDNDAALARIIGSSKDEWLAVAPTVRPFFEASNGKLVHSRCEEELHAQACQAHATSIKNKAAANSRWAKQRELKAIHALAYQPHTPRMPNHATLQDIRKKEDGETVTARSLATALPAGALASEPRSEQVAKRPSEVSRAELDARIAARRTG